MEKNKQAPQIEPTTKYTACHLPMVDRATVEQMATEQDRSIGYIVVKLIQAGLRAQEKTATCS